MLTVIVGLIWIVMAVAFSTSVFADADGPDYYRVKGVAADDVLNIRARPSAKADKVGEIPPDGDGVRNLGCQGGPNIVEWEQMTPSEREAASHKRWCRIEFGGIRGWVAGRFLAEGSAP